MLGSFSFLIKFHSPFVLFQTDLSDCSRLGSLSKLQVRAFDSSENQNDLNY